MRVFICVGLPASGKSTWAKEQVRQSKGKIKRINKDDLRAMLDNSIFSKDNEKYIHHICHTLLWECLEAGYDVIIDDTNLNPSTFKGHIDFIDKYKKITGKYGISVLVKEFNVPVEECIRRNKERTNRVPEDVIVRMYNSYSKKK